MQNYFYNLADYATSKLQGKEVFTSTLNGESSDFCRLNGGKVRQAGSVLQNMMSLQLINGKKNAQGNITLCSVRSEDEKRIDAMIAGLRDQISVLQDDPYLLYNTKVRSSENISPNKLADSRDIIAGVAKATHGSDLVGIYAAGAVYRAFANSLGQRNWYENYSFNFDFSFYLRADKAVKTGYAGFEWKNDDFNRKLEVARRQLAILDRTPKTITPGRYRVYLAPQALTEVTDMISWGGFSLKAHKTKQTPLLRMVEANASMNSEVSIFENTAGGISPDFNSGGFTKPGSVTLIDHGRYKDCLVSPRSSVEYGIETNGANSQEIPSSLEFSPGSISSESILTTLGDGIYLNNLWYLNFSDRSACRVTGMTRFASFWVENGQIVQPLNVMRFDESLLRMFGEKLVGFTKEREMMISASTYGERSTGSAHLPGALVDDFSLTL
jgi:predicted Zn-dependent protease